MATRREGAEANRNRRELLAGLCMFAFSAVAFFYANRLPDSRVFTVGGTGMVPFLATLFMLVLSFCKCLSALLGAREETVAAPEKLNGLRTVAVLALVGLFAVSLEKLGFLVSSALFLFLALPLFGVRSLKTGVIYGIVTSLVTWFLFSKVFSSHLPSGTFLR